MGNIGSAGRCFFEDLSQASGEALRMAFIGGIIFNLANILLVAAIDIAGMAVAFKFRLEQYRHDQTICRDPVPFGDYIKKGNPKLHMIGILGGMIWSIGMSFSIIASGQAGFAISYGLGQGATMVAAFWGVFIWKEFKGAPAGTNKLLAFMFASFIAGLGLIIFARII